MACEGWLVWGLVVLGLGYEEPSARLYFEAHELKSVLLTSRCIIGVVVLMGRDRAAEVLVSIVCFLASCVGSTFAVIIFFGRLL